MTKEINVKNLNSKTVEEIKSAITALEKSTERIKELTLILENTKGKHSVALALVRVIHSSSVDVFTISNGTLGPAGVLLAAAGKKGERIASIDTVFVPFEKEVSNSTGRLTPFNQSVIRGLNCLKGNGRALKNVALNNQALSFSEAKKFRLIDKIDDFERKDSNDSSRSTRGTTPRGTRARSTTVRDTRTRGTRARSTSR